LVEICLIEKNDWIMWRSVRHEKWGWDYVDEMRHSLPVSRRFAGRAV
jgi:hypothetical protein